MGILKKKIKVNKEKKEEEIQKETQDSIQTDSNQDSKSLDQQKNQEPVVVNYHYQRLIQEEKKLNFLEFQTKLMEEQVQVLKGIGNNFIEVGKILDEKLETEGEE